MFKNLLDNNAAKFGPPEGPVQVRLSGGEFSVRDCGPGIAEEDLPFVFDRSLPVPCHPARLLVPASASPSSTRSPSVTAARSPRSCAGGGTVMRLTFPVLKKGSAAIEVFAKEGPDHLRGGRDAHRRLGK